MTDTNEIIADIIAEKRRQADKIERDVAEKMKRDEMTSDQYARELVADMRREADRLEAANRREIDVLKQRCAELDAEVAAKDEVIKRLNDAIAEEQRRKMATAEKSSAVGDAAKLREALLKANGVLIEAAHHNLTEEYINECLALIHAALAAPARNCDVGTPEEQNKRLCSNYFSIRRSDHSFTRTALEWAQMPYEEGVE